MIIPTYNWQFAPQVEDADFTKIAKKAGLGPEAARLLFSRGIKDEDSLSRFLVPSLDDLHDPYLLHDMDKACLLYTSVDDINGKIRLVGYKEALKAAGVNYSEGLVFESKYRYDDGYTLAERLVSSKATAAIVTGDELAAGLLNGLADHGISVPEDFEIITSDDSQIARYTRPNLTTIAQPLYDLGAISMRMLTKIMHKEELEEREVLLPHGLTERKSTRKK